MNLFRTFATSCSLVIRSELLVTTHHSSPVVLSTDLHRPGVGPELRQQFVDVDIAARLPVDTLRHDAVAVHELDALVHNHGNIIVSDLLVSQDVRVVESDHLDVGLPDGALLLRPHQDVEAPVIEVTDKHRVLGEGGRNAQVLTLLPDEDVLQFLEIDVLGGLSRVVCRVAEMSVGQTQPGELPVGSEA